MTTKPTNSGKRWKARDDGYLELMADKQQPLARIAQFVGRSETATMRRLNRLGYVRLRGVSQP